jgi:hypothetical protein
MGLERERDGVVLVGGVVGKMMKLVGVVRLTYSLIILIYFFRLRGILVNF